MTWSGDGSDSDERWVLDGQPRDPRGLWPPTRVELILAAVSAAMLLTVAVVLLLVR